MAEPWSWVVGCHAARMPGLALLRRLLEYAWLIAGHYDIRGNVRVASQNEKRRSVQINRYIMLVLFGTGHQTGSHKNFIILDHKG